MSWCDKLASTPGVGLRLDPHYAASESILTAMSPMFDRFAEGDKAKFALDRLEAFALSVSTDEGFIYTVEPNSVNVQFKHRMRAKPTSAGLPVMEMLSEARPYTELLPQAIERLQELVIRLPGPSSRSIRRIGIVTHTIVAEEEMPPGVAKLIDYIGRPWSSNTDFYNIQVSGILSDRDHHTDRCIYHLVRPEDKEQLNSFLFDFQRIFKKGQPINQESFADIVSATKKSALDYFENIAEGSQWDEDIISGTAE